MDLHNDFLLCVCDSFHMFYWDFSFFLMLPFFGSMCSSIRKQRPLQRCVSIFWNPWPYAFLGILPMSPRCTSLKQRESNLETLLPSQCYILLLDSSVGIFYLVLQMSQPFFLWFWTPSPLSLYTSNQPFLAFSYGFLMVSLRISRFK